MALQQRFQAYEDANEKDQQSMEALTEALNALRARPPTPPSLPLEFILSTIDEPIRDSVQSAVRPIVDRMAKQLQEKIVQQDAEIYGQLWDKITLTLKVVNAVSKVTPAASPVS
ncbi:hypothetical protein B0H11DRAFT_290008 [Mycena galericulata]|nr:hypothetical protein B0H11DRAFT_290008 [Mycena galericulata]